MIKKYERTLRVTGKACFTDALMGKIGFPESSIPSQDTILIIKQARWELFVSGYKAYLFEDDESNIPSIIRNQLIDLELPYVTNVNPVQEFLKDDVVVINDSQNFIRWLYRADSNDNVLLVTNQCNSNCVMCPDSEYLRKNSLLAPLAFLSEWIKHLPAGIQNLCISGGEPTLLKEELFDLLHCCRQQLPKCYFLLLTNGRMFAYRNFVERYIQSRPQHMVLGIPLHSMESQVHDYITAEPGSFHQTVAGISQLLEAGERVEIRVVVQKHNVKQLLDIANYIGDHFPRTLRVNFMALEMLGNAMKNKNEVWVPFQEVHDPLEMACRALIKKGVPVKLYNFPLCHISPQLWTLNERSITDHKICFASECSNCEVKTMCGGFFSTTLQFCEYEVFPVMG